MVLFPHTASQKGSLASLGPLRVGCAPCPRQAGRFFGAFLLEWVWCRCLTFRGGEGRGSTWAGSAARPPGWNRGGAINAPLCSGASLAISGREPGGQVKWDEGAAWSGILVRAHPRAYTVPPGRPSSPRALFLGPKDAFLHPTWTVIEA